MCLRFVFLITARLVAAGRLSCRDTEWKNAEILLLRHQLSVVQRRLGEQVRPKVCWADRALIALLLAPDTEGPARPAPSDRHARPDRAVAP